MSAKTQFSGDDLRGSDPKFQPPRFQQYLDAVSKLDHFAQQRYGTRAIHLAVRWVLDRYEAGIALWGARRPDQLAPIHEVMGWHIDTSAMAEIDEILAQTVKDPVGPEFMAPPQALAA
jgi:aryl-alcohol dehydrogenase-like predicted oxidoreductase